VNITTKCTYLHGERAEMKEEKAVAAHLILLALDGRIISNVPHKAFSQQSRPTALKLQCSVVPAPNPSLSVEKTLPRYSPLSSLEILCDSVMISQCPSSPLRRRSSKLCHPVLPLVPSPVRVNLVIQHDIKITGVRSVRCDGDGTRDGVVGFHCDHVAEVEDGF
jgi:hypothetical protein